MSTFEVVMRLHRTVTIRVEAKSEEEIYSVLDENDDLDPETYWKSSDTSDWNQVEPFIVNKVEGKADYVIGDTKFGRDFVIQLESGSPNERTENKASK